MRNNTRCWGRGVVAVTPQQRDALAAWQRELIGRFARRRCSCCGGAFVISVEAGADSATQDRNFCLACLIERIGDNHRRTTL